MGCGSSTQAAAPAGNQVPPQEKAVAQPSKEVPSQVGGLIDVGKQVLMFWMRYRYNRNSAVKEPCQGTRGRWFRIFLRD